MTKLKKYIKENYLLIIIFVVLSVIEIAFIFPVFYKNSLSYDSSYQYGLTLHTIPEIWRLLPYDYSPPFYAIALKLYCMVFGQSLVVMRTFSIFAVVGMLFIAAFPVSTLFNKKTSVYCMLITFCSTTILGLIHEIRPTIFAMFFFMAVVVYGGIAFSTGKRYSYICLVIFSLLSMYTHNVAMVGTLCVYVTLLLFSAVKRDRKMLRNFFVCGVICAILYLPWLRIIISQTSEVKEYFWTTNTNIIHVFKWMFIDFQVTKNELHSRFIKISFFLVCSFVLFGGALNHLDLKKLKGAKKFREIVKIPHEKNAYIKILFVFTVIILSVAMMEIVMLVIRNLRSPRYYYILSMAFIVWLSAILSYFGNKICCCAYLFVFLLNHASNIDYIKTEADRADIETIVSDIEKRCPDGNICFLHTHEYSLGLMSYYFPDATHYVYDGTGTVIRDLSVFGTEVIDIGDFNNIWNYTDCFYVSKIEYAGYRENISILDELEETEKCEAGIVGIYTLAYDGSPKVFEPMEVVLADNKQNINMEEE